MTKAIVVDGEVASPLRSAGRAAAVADLLDAARPHPGADHATVHSVDGRLTVPDGRTLCWNVKDVGRIEVTCGHRPDSVPDDPGH